MEQDVSIAPPAGIWMLCLLTLCLVFLYIYQMRDQLKDCPLPRKAIHTSQKSHYKLSYYHPLSICDRTLFAKWINKSNCLLFKLIQKMYFLSFEVNSLCDQKHFYLIPRHCWYRFFFFFPAFEDVQSQPALCFTHLFERLSSPRASGDNAACRFRTKTICEIKVSGCWIIIIPYRLLWEDPAPVAFWL